MQLNKAIATFSARIPNKNRNHQIEARRSVIKTDRQMAGANAMSVAVQSRKVSRVEVSKTLNGGCVNECVKKLWGH